MYGPDYELKAFRIQEGKLNALAKRAGARRINNRLYHLALKVKVPVEVIGSCRTNRELNHEVQVARWTQNAKAFQKAGLGMAEAARNASRAVRAFGSAVGKAAADQKDLNLNMKKARAAEKFCQVEDREG